MTNLEFELEIQREKLEFELAQLDRELYLQLACVAVTTIVMALCIYFT